MTLDQRLSRAAHHVADRLAAPPGSRTYGVPSVKARFYGTVARAGSVPRPGGARLGPGPRDGLMTGLHARTGWPIWKVRSLIEGSVLLLGWWLGGNVGVGTLVFALLIGPLCGVTLGWFGIGRPSPVVTAAGRQPQSP